MKPEALYPYTRNNPDLLGYGAVAAGTVVGFFAVVLLYRTLTDALSTPAAPPTSPVSPPTGAQ